jgi:putative ABC transport system substrate-binding protein
MPSPPYRTVLQRRHLIAAAVPALAWPQVTPAQPAGAAVIGYLSSKDAAAEKTIIAAARRGLARNGFVEGRNLSIEFSFSDGDYSRLAALARDLVERRVALIVTSGVPATLAARDASATIPIVFRLAVDPVAFGLAKSLNRPGGNLTGVTMLFDPLTPKKLQLLHELVPSNAPIGFLLNPRNQNAASHQRRAEEAAKDLGLRLLVLRAGDPGELEAAFAAARQAGVASLLVGDDPFFDVSARTLTDAAARHAIATMYYVRDFVDVGGLVSYGPDFAEMAEQAGDYAGRILKGAQPGDLPIGQPTRIDLVINLKAARAIGVSVPPSLLARADAVIE